MKHLIFIFLFVFNIAICNENTLPYPYNSIELLPFDKASEFGPRQAAGLSYLIEQYNIRTVIEIGSYLGGSTRFIAKLLPEEGKVYAVDHWQGNEEWEMKPNFPIIQKSFYQKFLSNVIHENLCHKIVPMKMSSLSAAAIINVIPDLVFIDGSHDYESVYNDISAWYPHVNGHGILCGDDYNWGGSKPVKKAVHQFAKENNLTVKIIEDWFWYYENK